MDVRRLVGLNFERLRREKGFTQESFAEVSGVPQQYVSGLENGKRNPTVLTLHHLAAALGVKPAALLAEIEKDQLDVPARSGQRRMHKP